MSDPAAITIRGTGEAGVVATERKGASKDKAGEVSADYARIIELSEVNSLPKKRLFLPRFRTIANLIKSNNDNLVSFFEIQKKGE